MGTPERKTTGGSGRGPVRRRGTARRALGVIVPVIAAISAVAPAAPAAPALVTVHYEGLFTDDAGAPLEGPLDVTFRIFASATGGGALWSETHASVMPTRGRFGVELGSITPLGGAFDGPGRWLEVEPGGGPPLSPRRRFGSVPYAFRGDVARTIAGVDDGDWLYSGVDVHRPQGSVGIGTSTPGADIHVAREGDASVRLEADTTGEKLDARASILLTQDGGVIGGEIALGGDGDLTVRRFSPGPDTTSISLVATDHDIEINADVLVGGAVAPGAPDGPSERLLIRGRSASWTLGVQNETLAANSDFFIGRTASEDGTFHIERDGNVGVGTTTPDAKLDVDGGFHADRFTSTADLGAGVAPPRGGFFGDNIVYAWASVDYDGTMLESFGFDETVIVDENRYRLTMKIPVPNGDVCVLATSQGFAHVEASPNLFTTIDVFTGREFFPGTLGDLPAPFSVIVVGRP